MRNIANFVAFQIAWFCNVLGAANAMPWLGPAVTLAWMVGHFATLPSQRSAEAHLIFTAALLGWVTDSLLVMNALIAFPDFAHLGGPSPLWMVALWISFAATLRHSLGWMRGRWFVGACFGAVGGPLAYLGGQALGAIEIAGNISLIAISVQYAIATPVLLAVVQRAQSVRLQHASDTTAELC